jgi:hypothetical protein
MAGGRSIVVWYNGATSSEICTCCMYSERGRALGRADKL